MILYVLDISSIHMRFNDTIIRTFVDINECDPNPCIFLFDCEDHIDGYQCNLIQWELALMILSFVLLSLIAICIFTYIHIYSYISIKKNTKIWNTTGKNNVIASFAHQRWTLTGAFLITFCRSVYKLFTFSSSSTESLDQLQSNLEQMFLGWRKYIFS